MKLVFAGYIRVYDDVLEESGSLGTYLSSSPYTNSTIQIWGLSVSKLGVVNASIYRQINNAYSVRCFKNDYVRHPKTVIYNPN
jgi:hypothetical protein